MLEAFCVASVSYVSVAKVDNQASSSSLVLSISWLYLVVLEKAAVGGSGLYDTGE